MIFSLKQIQEKCIEQNLFVDLIASLHKDMKASVSLKGELSKPFDVQNGVKQGCVLTPTLFSLFLSKVLDCAFAGCDEGVTIQSNLGANL